MVRTPVTNAQFAATGYRTTAERPPGWETLKEQLPRGTLKPPNDMLVPGAMVFVGTAHPVDLNDYAQWWRFVPGADLGALNGPGTSIAGKEDYPVVQVSYEDVRAYALCVRKRISTETEWEFAERGGLEQTE
jgi:formylglycine-generating enzyme